MLTVLGSGSSASDFFGTLKTERLPERIKSLTLARGVVARLRWVNAGKFPPFSEDLLSPNIEFGQRVDLMLYKAIPNGCPMFLHVGLHARFSLYVGRPTRVHSDSLRGLAIGQLAGENEMRERYFQISDWSDSRRPARSIRLPHKTSLGVSPIR